MNVTEGYIYVYIYREDSVTEVAMDVTELVGGGEVVGRKGGGRGGHFC